MKAEKFTILRTDTFTKGRISIFALFLVLTVGCSLEVADFKTITGNFLAATNSTVSKLELIPVKVASYQFTLTRKLISTDSAMNARIVREISFPAHPDLPRALDHAGCSAECKMAVHFTNGEVFSFHIYFCEGPVGRGVEYAIYPEASLDGEGREERLPGNDTLGRGYSIAMYELLRGTVKEAGVGWTKGP